MCPPGKLGMGADLERAEMWMRAKGDLYDAVQDARSDRSEWNEGDVADDAVEAFRWGFTPDGRESEEAGREQ